MQTNVVSLESYREHSWAKQHRNGVKLPQIYRVEGFYFHEVNGELVPSNEAAAPRYTLATENACGLAHVSWTPINQLDPELDDGWLMVRHHPVPRESIEAYLDALNDMVSDADDATGQVVYQTDEGLFTLIHRKPAPGAPNNLIIHIMKDSIEGCDVYRIIHPHGSITEDYLGLVDPNDAV